MTKRCPSIVIIIIMNTPEIVTFYHVDAIEFAFSNKLNQTKQLFNRAYDPAQI